MSENYQIKRAKEFSNYEIDNFKKIVLSKGQVIENTFDGLLEKNPVLLFYPDSKNIEAVGALKIPNKSYKDKIFKQSNSTENPDRYEFELGWIVSLKIKKGNGRLITKILCEYSSKIYATVREDNSHMIRILESLNYKKSGNRYNSTRGKYKNILYIKK